MHHRIPAPPRSARGMRGQAQTEYIIVLIAIAIVVLAIATVFGSRIRAYFLGGEEELALLEGGPGADWEGTGGAASGAAGGSGADSEADGDAATEDDSSDGAGGPRAGAGARMGRGSGAAGAGGSAGGSSTTSSGPTWGNNRRAVERVEAPPRGKGPNLIAPGGSYESSGGRGDAAAAPTRSETSEEVRRRRTSGGGEGDGFDVEGGGLDLTQMLLFAALVLILMFGARAAFSKD